MTKAKTAEESDEGKIEILLNQVIDELASLEETARKAANVRDVKKLEALLLVVRSLGRGVVSIPVEDLEEGLDFGAALHYMRPSFDGKMADVAVEGRCRVVCDHECNEARYEGEIIENPTWGHLMDEAGAQMTLSGDTAHCFLEGVKVVREEGGVKILELQLGS
jgi:sugar phosphate isomerase/epimerase